MNQEQAPAGGGYDHGAHRTPGSENQLDAGQLVLITNSGVQLFVVFATGNVQVLIDNVEKGPNKEYWYVNQTQLASGSSAGPSATFTPPLTSYTSPTGWTVRQAFSLGQYPAWTEGLTPFSPVTGQTSYLFLGSSNVGSATYLQLLCLTSNSAVQKVGWYVVNDSAPTNNIQPSGAFTLTSDNPTGTYYAIQQSVPT
jgi:hypothetical protein